MEGRGQSPRERGGGTERRGKVKKICPVTTGTHSETSVQAALSTREKAETFAELHPGDPAVAAEFTVDEFDPERPEPHFIEVLMERNGEMYEGPSAHVKTGDLAQARANLHHRGMEEVTRANERLTR